MPFAPTPIVFRYGDNGLLGQAAAQAGYGQGVMQSLAHQQQTAIVPGHLFGGPAPGDPFGDEPDPQANQLQLAHQLMQSRQQQPDGSTPTDSRYFTKTGPLVQSVLAAKQLSRSSQLGGLSLSDEQNKNLDTLEKDPTISPQDYESAVRNVASGADAQSKRASRDAEAQAKQQVIAASAGSIAPEDTDIIKGYAADPRFSTNDVRLAVQQSSQKQTARAAVTTEQHNKAALISKLPQEVQDHYAPLVSDPKVTTTQLHQAMTQDAQRDAQAARQQQNADLTLQKTKVANIRNDLREYEKDPAMVNATGPEDFKNDPEGLKKYQAYQSKKQALDSAIDNIGSSTAPADQPQAFGGEQQPLSVADVMNMRAPQQQPGMQLTDVRGNAAPQQQFVATATNPQTGHKIGKRADGAWVDAQTGAPIQ